MAETIPKVDSSIKIIPASTSRIILNLWCEIGLKCSSEAIAESISHSQKSSVEWYNKFIETYDEKSILEYWHKKNAKNTNDVYVDALRSYHIALKQAIQNSKPSTIEWCTNNIKSSMQKASNDIVIDIQEISCH